MTNEELARAMEWERTKGSLRAILASYSDSLGEAFVHWSGLHNKVEGFIKSFGEQSGID